MESLGRGNGVYMRAFALLKKVLVVILSESYTSSRLSIPYLTSKLCSPFSWQGKKAFYLKLNPSL